MTVLLFGGAPGTSYPVVESMDLVEPVTGRTVHLHPRDGFTPSILDIQPAARAVEEDRIGGHGTYDTTKYMGPAVVAFTFMLYPTPSQAMEAFFDEIMSVCDPAMRPQLVVTHDAWAAPRQLTLRYDSASKAFSDPTNWTVQLVFRAPASVWQSVTPSEWFIPASIASTTGLHMTATGLHMTSSGLHVPATTQVSGSEVTGGGAVCPWQARLYGPCTAPAFVNDTVGQGLVFTGDLVLAPGDYVYLDSQLQTAVRASDGADVTKLLDFASSDWWQLPPGVSLIRYAPAAASPGAEADLLFSPSFLA